jgi:hypothetical protein
MIRFVKEGFDTLKSKSIKIGEVIDLGELRNKLAIKRGLAVAEKQKK